MQVIVGMGNAYDASTPEKEKTVWSKIFKHHCEKGYYTEPDGSWAQFSEIKVSKSIQELYRKAKSGDLASLRTLLMRSGVWHLLEVRDSNAPINL